MSNLELNFQDYQKAVKALAVGIEQVSKTV